MDKTGSSPPNDIREPVSRAPSAGTAAHRPEVRRQKALPWNQALQSGILNSANVLAIVTDEAGVIQTFNAGAARALGYTADEVQNKVSLAKMSDRQEVLARAKSLSAEFSTPIMPGFETLVFKASLGIEDISEWTCIRKDGTRFPALVSATALRDDDGAVIGYLVIGIDHSGRGRADEGLSWTEESFRLLVEGAANRAIMTLDTNGHVLGWNEGAQALLGYAPEEIVGQHFSRFYLPEDSEAGVPQRDLTVATDGGRFEEQGRRVRKDGSVFPANVVLTAIRGHGGSVRGFGLLTLDLTGQKRAEAELANARATAERATLAKSDFLSSMSHGLRVPLNAMLGFAQLMESDSPPPAPAQRENIAQILRSGWQVLKLIDEILDLAMIESRRVPLSMEPVSLGDVLLECQGIVEPQAQQRSIQLSFPPFDMPHFVRADRTRLMQVLTNLLSNAIKYNIKRGQIEVTCVENGPERLRVSIRDTGAGLYPEQVAQLFQPFNRLGQEAGGEEGTGLGLVVAKQLVELMGGAIGVESATGLGSVFWFELDSIAAPHVAGADGDAAALADPDAPGAAPARTLLYIEDNPANFKLVEQILARHPDVRLLNAANGSGGIEIARTAHPDLILMDINLPGMDGYEALALLRSNPATADIPVIALSANAMRRDIKKGLQAGFVRYITKPLKIDEFMDTLDAVLEQAGEPPGKSE